MASWPASSESPFSTPVVAVVVVVVVFEYLVRLRRRSSSSSSPAVVDAGCTASRSQLDDSVVVSALRRAESPSTLAERRLEPLSSQLADRFNADRRGTPSPPLRQPGDRDFSAEESSPAFVFPAARSFACGSGR